MLWHTLESTRYFLPHTTCQSSLGSAFLALSTRSMGTNWKLMNTSSPPGMHPANLPRTANRISPDQGAAQPVSFPAKHDATRRITHNRSVAALNICLSALNRRSLSADQPLFLQLLPRFTTPNRSGECSSNAPLIAMQSKSSVHISIDKLADLYSCPIVPHPMRTAPCVRREQTHVAPRFRFAVGTN